MLLFQEIIMDSGSFSFLFCPPPPPGSSYASQDACSISRPQVHILNRKEKGAKGKRHGPGEFFLIGHTIAFPEISPRRLLLTCFQCELSHDAHLTARELRRFIVWNGHNDTLKNKNWGSVSKDKEESEYWTGNCQSCPEYPGVDIQIFFSFTQLTSYRPSLWLHTPAAPELSMPSQGSVELYNLSIFTHICAHHFFKHIFS